MMTDQELKHTNSRSAMKHQNWCANWTIGTCPLEGVANSRTGLPDRTSRSKVPELPSDVKP